MASYLRRFMDYVTGADSVPTVPNHSDASQSGGTKQRRPTQPQASVPAVPVITETPQGDGGTQGLRWYVRQLLEDMDGDMAHAFLHEVMQQPTGENNTCPSSSKFRTHNLDGIHSWNGSVTAHNSSQALADRLQSQVDMSSACESREVGALPPARSGQSGDAKWCQDRPEGGVATERKNEAAYARATFPETECETAPLAYEGGKIDDENTVVTSQERGSQKRQRQAVAQLTAGSSSSNSVPSSSLVPCDPASLHAAPLQWYPVTIVKGDVVIANAIC